MKEIYDRTELEIIKFQSKNVIMTSDHEEYEGWNPYDNPQGSGSEYEGWNAH